MKSKTIVMRTVCGIDELPDHGKRRVSHVLSILDPDHGEPESFAAYPLHNRATLRFHDAIAPAPGIVLPQRADVEAILNFGRSLGAEGAAEAHILVHCHLGISRSTAALAILMADAEPETPAADLIAQLHAQRDKAWPNARMIAFADELLGRQGTLSEAVRRLHGLQLRKRPHLAQVMRDLGRAGEVDAAQRE